MTINLLKHVAAACLVMLAAGCATVAPPESADSGPAVERRYNDSIDLSGRLSIRYEQDRREQAVHGSFTWNQSARHIVLSLLSPLGQTLATIDIKPGIAVLTQSGKPPLSAADVDVLTEQALGWPLPVSGLRDWLQGFGRGADGKAFVAQPSRDTVRFTTRDGWNLSYGEWQDDAAKTEKNRPKRIDLTRETKQAGPVSIRIVIDDWQSH
ncbi:lipoprotein insertase outer membrane protein LolB [Herbaspirillum rhizosphaerae]|uniref:Outer-membrane lipoprotein LolB n=1 Tax=Herbaspirillum rhizosphaerae TaxID=346179 RepID=A0ABW8ZC52_9BURK